jgi:hypothetical protein
MKQIKEREKSSQLIREADRGLRSVGEGGCPLRGREGPVELDTDEPQNESVWERGIDGPH